MTLPIGGEEEGGGVSGQVGREEWRRGGAGGYNGQDLITGIIM